MGGIRDEGQLLDERFRIHSHTGMELGGKPPRPELVTHNGLVGLVAGDGRQRCELPDELTSLQACTGE